jgi:hypothetical protein
VRIGANVEQGAVARICHKLIDRGWRRGIRAVPTATVPLAAAGERGVGRLGQVRGDPGRGQLLAESAWSAVPALPLARF